MKFKNNASIRTFSPVIPNQLNHNANMVTACGMIYELTDTAQHKKPNGVSYVYTYRLTTQ